MIAAADRSPAGADAGSDSETLSDDPVVDVDMAAHVAMERALLPPSRPALALAAGRRFVAARAPLLRSSFGSAILLGLRFVQARLISVWGLIIAAALCPPFVFAAFAVFSAIVNFVSTAALLRLEAVFFHNRDRHRLGLAFRLACVVGVGFLGLSAVILAGLALSGWVAPAVALIFLISLAARSVLRLLRAEATAEGDFRAIGNSNVVQALVQPAIMLLLIGLVGPKALALFLADALGHALAAAYLLRRRLHAVSALVAPPLWSWCGLTQAAWRWRDAPRAMLPAALLAYGFAIAPVLALPYAANTVLAAHVALSMRLLDMPTQMFGTVSVPIVLNRLRFYVGPRRRLWARLMALALIAAAAVLFGAIAFVLALGDPLLADTHWAGIGTTIALMAPFYAGLAVLGPLQEMATLSRQPFWQVAINALALIAIVAVMALSDSLSPAMLEAIGLISILRTLLHTLFIWLHLGEATEPGAEGFALSGAAR